MQLDFEVQRCTRHCANTQRKLDEGESFYSVLTSEGANIVRNDISTQAWEGPPQGVFAWWKSRMPASDSKQPKLAPNDVLLELFDQLSEQPHNQDMRYVLALLLVRRRVFRQEDSVEDDSTTDESRASSKLTVFCSRRDATYEVPEALPDQPRIDAIQAHLTELLYADAE